jgi:hypothetical protein
MPASQVTTPRGTPQPRVTRQTFTVLHEQS